MLHFLRWNSWFAILITPIIIASCSKSNDEITSPDKPTTPPSKTDSTKKDSNTISLAKRDTIIYQNMEISEFPILSKRFGDSIALGMYTTQTNSLLTQYPKMGILDNKYWSNESFYTTAIGDSFQIEAIPNKANQEALIQKYLKGDHAFKQWAGSSLGSKGDMGGRFNELRTFLGINEDVKDLFGLDKNDTSKLDITYKRVVYYMEATKFNALIENAPTSPDYYLNIKNGTTEWTNYFGQETPSFVNEINYGYSATMVFESKEIDKLSSVLSNLFSQSITNLKNGNAISNLSSEDQAILSSTKFYGFKLGIGKVDSHNVSNGLKDVYSYISSVTDNDNFIGYPIRYMLNGYKKSDPTLKISFNFAHYTTYQPTASK